MTDTATETAPPTVPSPEIPDYNWDEITGSAVERLRAPKVKPVPAPIVRQAQRSFDGVPKAGSPDVLLHVIRHRFESDVKAAVFARLMKHAGSHTTPETSVSVVIDPDNAGDLRMVAWRAGSRRGRPSA